MRKLIWKILNAFKLGAPVQIAVKSQIKEDGWFNSFYKKESVDRNNNPLPWYTYPFIKFIESRLSKEFNVFEYGSGNSTIWLSGRVKHIKSVEHHRGWYDKVKNILPGNAEIIYKEVADGEYAKAVNSDDSYDIIIVDGVDRNNCVYESVKSLSVDGVIIYDNSDRDEYNESIDFLLSQGYRKIDFWGMGPVTPINSCTSIFYRDNNCLGI